MSDENAMETLHKLMLEIIEELANLRTGKRGRYYAELFMVEPDGTEYPEYYEIIKNPMSLDTVKQNVNDGAYSSFDDFEKDMRLIFDNAMIFNEEESQVYNDASHLQRSFEAKLARRKKAYEEFLGNMPPSKSKKRKHPPEEDGESRSVKLKISLKEPEDRPSKIKLSIGKGRATIESEAEESLAEEEPERKSKSLREEKPHRGRGRPPRHPKVEDEGDGSDNEVKLSRKATRASADKSSPSDKLLPAASIDNEKAITEETVDVGSPTRAIRSTRSIANTTQQPSTELAADTDVEAARAGTSTPKAAESSVSTSTGPAILPSSVPALPVVVPSPNDVKSTSGSRPSGGQPQAQSKIAEESRSRSPGKTIADALITHFSISSTTRHPSFPPYFINFPPHEREVFQSFTVTLPAIYSVVTISPTLSKSLLTRHYNLYMSLNSRRLSPTIIPGSGVRKMNEPPKSFYEVKLNPGVNMIECLVHASPPPPPGMAGGRVVVAPQRYGLLGGTNTTVNSEGSEKERIVVWVLVQR
ncbi:hypothetical protein POJ06DRAFT_256577 [Lipomyces tetrasporus]|uniref:Bromo domain-containing protein n=1 Tax=Lipomyces tetrasporus TaxID=54092 RepID=A0AAD7QPN8_9ASCO|nr:uncharacterized protein POJ06DRAFT_256577 [Lipomyces tetrasporus]KAJ8099297.1 hypothetical protein POJ06DRAFT_256577 [Lipomyces tetrasporus]